MELVRTKIITKEEEKNILLQRAVDDPITSIRSLGGLTLYEFLQVFWEEVCQDKLVLNWHMELICHELEELAEKVARNEPCEKDTIFNVPPGSTKTIICLIVFPAWAWTKWYWMKFITGSHSMPIALKSAVACRDLIKSEKYRLLYPEIGVKADEDNKSDFRVIKKEFASPGHVPRIHIGGGRFTTSVDSSVTGTHAHIILVDDPIDPKKAVSKTEINTANDWMGKTLSTRKTNKEVTPIVLIMQRLAQDDPTGYLLEKKPNEINHICLPGEINNYRNYVKPASLIEKYSKDGLLDPIRLSQRSLDKMVKDLGEQDYAGQVGQSPIPKGGGMFKVDKIIKLLYPPADVNFVQWVRYWDKAATEGGGCYSAGVKMVKLRSGKFIIMDVIRGQWATEERERMIKSVAEADEVDVEIGIEQEPGSSGVDSAKSTILNLAGFNAFREHPTGDKAVRAKPFSVQVNEGNVMMLHGDWNHDYLEELKFFPFGKYKDQVDASSGAFNRLNNKRTAGPV
jgi:predicted phage terminase large subunit-like protein